MFIQISDGYTHIFKIITRNICSLVNIDGIIIIILWIFFFIAVISFIQNQWFMPRRVIKISKPTDALYANVFPPILIHPAPRRTEWVIVRNIEFPITAVNTRPKPQFIVFDKGKNLFIGNRIHISDNQKIFLIRHKLGNIFAKQAKWWIGDYDVGLFKIGYTFFTAEISDPL